MKKLASAIIAICLVLCLLLSGCGIVDIGGYFIRLGQLLSSGYLTPFDQMVYTRPDMEHFDQVLQSSMEKAGQEQKISKLLDAIYAFYEVYDDFSTNYALVNIYYNRDLTDKKWEEEYNFCLEQAPVVDAALDSFYRALAKSPLRKELESDDYFGADFFQAYEGETLYDETFQDYLNQESQLISEYYTISAEASSADYYSETYFTQYGTRLAEVFVELVALRQQIAGYAGYESYPEFAYDFYFGRDYTVEQTTAYLSQIQTELVELYTQLNRSGFWSKPLPSASQKNTLDYVKTMATNMGGVIEEAFQDMVNANLYDISYSPNKFSGSFEVFIANYYSPYVFVNPTNTIYDKLTFAHEFGHFCADYESMGSAAGVDVAEVLSQGMEYLSLCYVPDQELESLKMADCLRVFVEQAAYASFEHQVYGLTGADLTVENVQALYEQIGTNFGLSDLNWDSRDYVCIPHFFISPMYVISYVVSNDVALQLYRLEKAQAGKGLACLTESLTTTNTGIVSFTYASPDLVSPFATNSLQEVRKVLEAVLSK